jgi:hypothetical protein
MSLKIVAKSLLLVYIIKQGIHLSKKEKIIKRLLSRLVDFSFAELTTLLGLLGYSLAEAGKTSGSRVVFIKGGDYIRLHKPHPENILKRYQIEDIIAVLKERGSV